MSTRVEDATGPTPSGETRFWYLPLMRDHDLTFAYGYARLLIGHSPEPWLICSLSDWLTGAEAELERRGLLKHAKRTKKLLLKEHHARGTIERGTLEQFAARDMAQPQ